MSILRRVNNMSAGCWIAASMLVLAACAETNNDTSEDTSSDETTTSTPAGPPGTGDALTSSEASRFLGQATFGPSDADIDNLTTIGASAWLQAEFAKPQESLLQEVLLAETAGEDVGPNQLSETFWTRAILSDDQLRQRVGYALSQIIVASYADSQLADRPVAMANYMDIMAAGAFGNFRQLLENVTFI